MPIIKYIEHNGNDLELDVPVGNTLMEGAVDNGIESILAECGGACACATCHVYIDEAWMDKVGKAEDEEAEMLDMVEGLTETSRLACQVEVTEEFEGLIVRLPEQQL